MGRFRRLANLCLAILLGALLAPLPSVRAAPADGQSVSLAVLLTFGQSIDGYQPSIAESLKSMPAEQITLPAPGFVERGQMVNLRPDVRVGAPREVYNQGGVSVTITATPAQPQDRIPALAGPNEIVPAEGSMRIDYVVRTEGKVVQQGRYVVEDQVHRSLGASFSAGPGYLPAPTAARPRQVLALQFYMPSTAGPGEWGAPSGGGGGVSTTPVVPGRRPGDDPSGPYTCGRPQGPPTAAQLASQRQDGRITVRVKADRSGYETLDGSPLPAIMAGVAVPPPPANGWCDQPALATALDNSPVRGIRVLLTIGDKTDGVPLAAVDRIRANPAERFSFPLNGWAVSSESVMVEPFKALGEPAEIYRQGDLIVSATASQVFTANPDMVSIRLVTKVAGDVVGDSAKLLEFNPYLVRGIGPLNAIAGRFSPILSAASAAQPNRVVSIAMDWPSPAPSPFTERSLESLAEEPAFGGVFSAITDGIQRIGGPVCLRRFAPMPISTVASMLKLGGEVVVRAKEDRSGYEREDGEPLPAALTTLKPAPLPEGGYCGPPPGQSR
ncbi:MAG: hypothetical protein JWM33_3249 [Caulobacteraceae bacterium]|nr:hypothetical protein [Caulobacteraceae bacterium]